MNYKYLEVWQKAVELATKVCTATKTFPTKQKFEMVNEINHNAIAIAANLGQVVSSLTYEDGYRFFKLALDASFELESQLLISFKIRFIAFSEIESLLRFISDVQQMIVGLQHTLNYN